MEILCINCENWLLSLASREKALEEKAPCRERATFIYFHAREERDCEFFKEAQQRSIDKREAILTSIKDEEKRRQANW